MTASLPLAWQEAFRRDAAGAATAVADPLPERRVARLLAAWIAVGLFFLVFPGTVLGVWNLIGISSRQTAAAVALSFLQAHGHAQLFGWVGSFIIGICLYTAPKFRGAKTRSLALGWLMLALWAGAVGGRWVLAFYQVNAPSVWRATALAEIAVAILLVWQTSAKFRWRSAALWDRLIISGFLGLAVALGIQAAAVWNLAEPVVPVAINSLTIHLALWAFCFPLVWGFSVKIVPPLAGLAATRVAPALAGLVVLLAAVLLAVADLAREGALLTVIAVALTCRSLRIFEPAERRPKVLGVDRRYPVFVRFAFAWLVASAMLGAWSHLPGVLGASRHAFTVGFMATMIFAIGPRILPAFLNSRELWSARLMLASLVLITAGCALRITAEPLAYGAIMPAAWRVLPISAVTELAAVVLFAINMIATLATPIPAWIGSRQVTDRLTVYWYVTAYPTTRRILAANGLTTLARSGSVPKSLTLREAAAADGASIERLLAALRQFFIRRRARALRAL
ncbi:MAG TPA: NnrS family protein [Bryobacteraceae bacterium]|nr:NnrS family protein [Bryobacteraceae bacterium]